MSILRKIFGDANEKYVQSLYPVVQEINSLERDISRLSLEQIKEKTKELKEQLKNGKSLDQILPEAFTLCRQAAAYTLNQRHFDVQLIGGIILHQGKIAEMRTGEGKTLTATLPAFLNALAGNGVHVVTVNDYLAKRDVAWMGQIYDALGLSVGCVTQEGAYLYDANYPNTQNDQNRDLKGGFKVMRDYLRPVTKKEAYAADITYGTNNEFGFDYLRNNMVYDLSQQAQRGFYYVIIDEVDSILIDEARVPLIISSQSSESTEKYRHFTKIILPLRKDQDYIVDEKLKVAHFTEAGQDKIINKLGTDPWLENDITATHQLEAALRAKTLFFLDRDYVVKNGQIIIIDEFTGRMLPGRRWSQGLHQAIEAKEGVKIQAETLTAATITFQNYFRMYQKIAGMTGTAASSAEELDKVYGLQVAIVPTHRPMIRKDLPDKIFKTEEGKFRAVVGEIAEFHRRGQPVLVGTKSVEKNEYLGKLLEREGIPHQILNAKNHEREGEIIAQAGRIEATTIATNMAGRGVDIILGGNPQGPKQSRIVCEAGGLHVMGTERHDSRRIDNQLRGRSGRQGDPGSSQFFISLEDDLMRIFGGEKIKSLMNVLNVPDEQPIESAMISKTIESAQAKVEGFNFDARHRLLEYDDVMNKHREVIYKKRRAFLENPQFPISNFQKSGFTMEDFKKKKQELGEENFNRVCQFVSLRVLDTLWQDHLSNMEHMRESVSLRSYGGHDPLIEYKNEGRRLFKQLLDELDVEVAQNVLRAQLQKVPDAQFPIPNENQNSKIENWKLPARQSLGEGGDIENSHPKVGRNDPCPCGAINLETGQPYKYKKCGLINAPYHRKS